MNIFQSCPDVAYEVFITFFCNIGKYNYVVIVFCLRVDEMMTVIFKK